LDAPGPIRALVPFRNSFVAFKDNAIFVGDPGGPYTFSWRLVSSKVGCVAKHSVTELDGKLYWVHSSGFWEFDGSNLRNIGVPVAQSFLAEAKYITASSPGSFPSPGATITSFGVASVQSSGDDIDGVVCFTLGSEVLLTSLQRHLYYFYNVRSGKWGRYFHSFSVSGPGTVPIVKTSTADMQSFLADVNGRVWVIWPGSTLRSIRYPYALSDSDVATFQTGIYGDAKNASKDAEWYLRHLNGSTALVAADVAGTVFRYENEDAVTSEGSVSLTFNPEFNSLQGTAAGKNKALSVAYVTAKKVLLGGLAPVGVQSGKR
jgi:hypothetical protein